MSVADSVIFFVVILHPEERGGRRADKNAVENQAAQKMEEIEYSRRVHICKIDLAIIHHRKQCEKGSVYFYYISYNIGNWTKGKDMKEGGSIIRSSCLLFESITYMQIYM